MQQRASERSDFNCQRNDEEAVLDRGGTRSMLNTNFEKEELEGHRTLYIGVHVPLGRRSHRRHRHHGHRHRKRWLKFEEDVEDGGERWSKPYVATLSLHSLFELRSCILNGIVMLDMRAHSLEEIADMVLDQHEISVTIGEEVRRKIRNALLKQHHHQNQKKLANRIPIVRSFADIGKKQSEPHSMDKNGQMVSPQSQPCCPEGRGDGSRENSAVDFSKIDLHFMKKIPPGAEASNILVGELEFLEKPVVAFVRLSPAVLLNGLAEVPITTRFLFILLGPMGKGPQYHEIGRSIATLMTDEVFHDVAYKAKDRSDLVAGIDEFLDQVTVLPPGEWDPSIRIEPPKNVPSQAMLTSCMCLFRIFGGLILDVKRKIGHYLSDYTDAISLQCLASFLFLYCACMSPVITFGGLLGEATEGRISAIESLFGASMTGIAYSLFAGQPLTILGSTGPVLVFEKILFKFCKEYGLSYLSLRVCIGLWTSFFCLVLVATDASSLVCYITRFTEEAFASLICIIFIYEALEKLVHLGETYSFNMHNDLNKLTQYSCVCTEPSDPSNNTLQYWQEKNITSSEINWLGLDVKVRAIISDFAVFITIATMVGIDFALGVPSPKLQVPNEFKPTRDDRGWIVRPLGPNPWWTIPIAFIPALLCTILIFMDQQITAVIINRKEHKLKKGCGYHLDLFVVGVMLGVCSVMGLPWFVAATVLSISHVNSLKLESECSAPGEQPKFLGIREQRFTGLMIFVLMGCSVFMTSVLKFIPMPVLYGVFLYMGASSLRGIQFFDRLRLFGMPAKHQPDFIYLRHVPLRKVHLFTIIQLSCLVLLWVIKTSRAAIVFPMMVLALVFIRKLLDFIFTKRELSWLDDLMPESKKKKLEDAQNEETHSVMMEDEGIVQVPLEGNYKDDPSTVNISDEMTKTSFGNTWKSLSTESSKNDKSAKRQKISLPMGSKAEDTLKTFLSSNDASDHLWLSDSPSKSFAENRQDGSGSESSVVSGPSSPSAGLHSLRCRTCQRLFSRMKRHGALRKKRQDDQDDPASLSCDEWLLNKKRCPQRIRRSRGRLWVHLKHIRLRALKHLEDGMENPTLSCCSRPHVFLQRNLRRCKKVFRKPSKSKSRLPHGRRSSGKPPLPSHSRISAAQGRKKRKSSETDDASEQHFPLDLSNTSKEKSHVFDNVHHEALQRLEKVSKKQCVGDVSSFVETQDQGGGLVGTRRVLKFDPHTEQGNRSESALEDFTVKDEDHSSRLDDDVFRTPPELLGTDLKATTKSRLPCPFRGRKHSFRAMLASLTCGQNQIIKETH
ncbi:sodium-driven chloride bicarbonate exchanger isoform X5 [Silurus asotus]|uniref:Sodium-driven chloride bicarbonate exchanger isoform X5 n=1 Tax=Silurus asotus TaxID=30991 RepID=A0AAD5B337_SILAS|nr:sodium-driven chloride bicarbonate exchanger isoform X5 [Silurus asotus]